MKNFNSTTYLLKFLNDLKEFEREFEHIRDQIQISFNVINWAARRERCDRFLIRIHTPIYDDKISNPHNPQLDVFDLLYSYTYSYDKFNYAIVDLSNKCIYDDEMRERTKRAGHVATSLIVYHKGENLTLNNKFLRRLKFLIG